MNFLRENFDKFDYIESHNPPEVEISKESSNDLDSDAKKNHELQPCSSKTILNKSSSGNDTKLILTENKIEKNKNKRPKIFVKDIDKDEVVIDLEKYLEIQEEEKTEIPPKNLKNIQKITSLNKFQGDFNSTFEKFKRWDKEKSKKVPDNCIFGTPGAKDSLQLERIMKKMGKQIDLKVLENVQTIKQYFVAFRAAPSLNTAQTELKKFIDQQVHKKQQLIRLESTAEITPDLSSEEYIEAINESIPTIPF